MFANAGCVKSHINHVHSIQKSQINRTKYIQGLLSPLFNSSSTNDVNNQEASEPTNRETNSDNSQERRNSRSQTQTRNQERRRSSQSRSQKGSNTQENIVGEEVTQNTEVNSNVVDENEVVVMSDNEYEAVFERMEEEARQLSRKREAAKQRVGEGEDARKPLEGRSRSVSKAPVPRPKFQPNKCSRMKKIESPKQEAEESYQQNDDNFKVKAKDNLVRTEPWRIRSPKPFTRKRSFL
jgi:hypothetical protein